jgi:hypothetical protein
MRYLRCRDRAASGLSEAGQNNVARDSARFAGPFT